MTIERDLTLPLKIRVVEDGDTAHCTIETENAARPLRFEVLNMSSGLGEDHPDLRIVRAAAGNIREALVRGVAVIEAENRGCLCNEIMLRRERHFKGCALREEKSETPAPLPLLLHCPMCAAKHIDSGPWATKVHTDHACQRCGHVWRPAKVPTVGVHFLPGYKNDGDEPEEDPREIVASLFSQVNRALSPLSLVFASIDAVERAARAIARRCR